MTISLHKVKYPMTVASLIFVFSPMIIHASPRSTYREIAPIDNPDILSPRQSLERNIDVLSRRAPDQVTLDLRPWANRSWKLHSGLAATRYAESDFMREDDWESRKSYVRENSIATIFKVSNAKKREKLIDSLSAAEKYDLLVGDRQGTLTQAQWSAGEKYWRDRTMANWMGICEGSAAAGALYPEPLHAVDFTLSNGDILRFHVMDIKGLAALLWSSYNAEIPISGSRCGTKNPKTDRDGIVLSNECFDSNPASFHIAVLNFLGLQKRTFFINRVTSIEVWNVPVLEYKVRYYNPMSDRTAENIDVAKIPISQYRRDPFTRYRASQTSSVVGVEMRIKIAKGTTTSRDHTDNSSQTEMRYRYDLELDSSGNIIGGEWHQKSHPDFIWAVDEGFRPLSTGDVLLGADIPWDGGTVPAGWLGPIQRASSRNQPLEKIVKKLIELSRQ